MAATIMWLRGYHAGKTGVIPSHSNVPYLPLQVSGSLFGSGQAHPSRHIREAIRSRRIVTTSRLVRMPCLKF
jgi:hypothetical protein